MKWNQNRPPNVRNRSILSTRLDVDMSPVIFRVLWVTMTIQKVMIKRIFFRFE